MANPIQARGNLDEGRRAMILLKHKVLRSILLRRTKKGRAADLALPPRIVSILRAGLLCLVRDFKSNTWITFISLAVSGRLC